MNSHHTSGPPKDQFVLSVNSAVHFISFHFQLSNTSLCVDNRSAVKCLEKHSLYHLFFSMYQSLISESNYYSRHMLILDSINAIILVFIIINYLLNIHFTIIHAVLLHFITRVHLMTLHLHLVTYKNISLWLELNQIQFCTISPISDTMGWPYMYIHVYKFLCCRLYCQSRKGIVIIT